MSRVMSLPEFYDASDVVVEQHFATSKDGTRVPYFVMGRKQVLAKGMAPAIQFGYGGFQAPILPVYYTNQRHRQPARSQVSCGYRAAESLSFRTSVAAVSTVRAGTKRR